MATWALLMLPVLGLGLVGVFIALAMAFVPARAARILPFVRIGAFAVVVIATLSALGIAAYLLFADAVTVTFPVSPLPVELPDGVSNTQGATAHIVAGTGGLDHITADVTGLDLASRIPLAAAALLGGAMTVILALSVARLARSAASDDAFHPSISRAFVTSAIAVFGGGGLASVLTQFGVWRASEQVLGINGWSYTGPGTPDSLADLGWPAPADFELIFEFWPLLIAAGLAAVAVAFRSGERLATRAAKAEHDLNGLV